MKAELKEFFKIADVLCIKAYKEERFILVGCENMEVKLNYNSDRVLSHDLVFLNKCRRNEL